MPRESGPTGQGQHERHEHDDAEHVSDPPRHPVGQDLRGRQAAEQVQRTDADAGRDQARQGAGHGEQAEQVADLFEPQGQSEPARDERVTRERLQRRTRGDAQAGQ
jgi:hypothetical protein